MPCTYCSLVIRKKKAAKRHLMACAKRPRKDKETSEANKGKERDALFAQHPDYMPKSSQKGYEPHFVLG